MDTAFEKQSYMDHRLIWSGSIGGEENAECVVPDSMPDLGVIVDTDAILSLRSKDLSGGRLSVAADISVKILYQPEGQSVLRSLSVSMSSSLTAAVTAEDDCIPLVRLRVRTAEAKLLNSRKASVRIELAGMGYCYQKRKLELVSGVSACACAVETLAESSTACLISDVREKTFVLTDDFTLPAGLDDVEAILTQRVTLTTDDMEFADDKLVFRGRACSFLLLRQEENVYPCSYESSFSQIMEISGDVEPAPEITLALTGAYFDMPDHSGGKIGMELHLLAQVVCRKKAELCYVADAYSNQRVLKTEFSETALCCRQRDAVVRHSISCTAKAPREIGDILFARGSVSSAVMGEDGIDLSVNLRAVYRRSDGGYGCISRRVQETVAVESGEGESLCISGAAVTNVFSAVSAGGIDLRASVELHLQAQCLSTLRHLSGLEAEDDRLPDAPSVTLLRCAGEDELWQLAKTHRSTRAAILEANGGRSEGLLLIPKCR